MFGRDSFLARNKAKEEYLNVPLVLSVAVTNNRLQFLLESGALSSVVGQLFLSCFDNKLNR